MSDDAGDGPYTEQFLEFGRAVHDRRKSLHMSQADLSAKAGVARYFLSQIENGQANPSLKVVFGIAAALDVTASTLLRRRP